MTVVRCCINVEQTLNQNPIYSSLNHYNEFNEFNEAINKLS